MARIQKRKVLKKMQVQKIPKINEETISVTASIASSGKSKEGIKRIFFGLSTAPRKVVERPVQH